MRSYANRALAVVAEEMPDEDPALVKLYTLLTITLGVATTRQDVHDAWALWRMGTDPDHPSIVPFDQLTPEVQALDQPYVDAVHRAARRLDGMDGGEK